MPTIECVQWEPWEPGFELEAAGVAVRREGSTKTVDWVYAASARALAGRGVPAPPTDTGRQGDRCVCTYAQLDRDPFDPSRLLVVGRFVYECAGGDAPDGDAPPLARMPDAPRRLDVARFAELLGADW